MTSKLPSSNIAKTLIPEGLKFPFEAMSKFSFTYLISSGFQDKDGFITQDWALTDLLMGQKLIIGQYLWIRVSFSFEFDIKQDDALETTS